MLKYSLDPEAAKTNTRLNSVAVIQPLNITRLSLTFTFIILTRKEDRIHKVSSVD